jgi:hypothetical protein
LKTVVKILFSLLLFLTVLKASAQHFEWASTSSNLYSGFKVAVVDQSENIIVAGEAALPNFVVGDSWLHSSNGDSIKVNVFENPLLIVSYNPSGHINWMRRVIGGRYPAKVHGIVRGSDNKIYVLGSSSESAFFPELKQKIGYHHCFIYCLKTDGTPLWIKEDTSGIITRPTSFCITPDENFLIAGHMEHDKIVGNIKLSAGVGGANYLLCMDKDMKPLWGQNVQYKSKSCCILYDAKADVTPAGDIYMAGEFEIGGVFSNGGSYDAPVLEKETKSSQPYEMYLAAYTSSGKLKWVKTSGGESRMNALKVTDNEVVIGGYIQNNGTFFDEKIDTTQKKKMLLACFSKGGTLKWAKTSKAEMVNAIGIDQEDNIYASVSSKQNMAPLILETDTIKKSYMSLLIASFSSEGKYRWVKTSSIPMSGENPVISFDHCGNLYISGEMFYTLKSQVSWFDAAFVKGNGYGSAPFVAKLKNTMPFSSGKEGVCVICQKPWLLQNAPNPFREYTEFVYTTSNDDPSVSLEIYDLGGKLIATLFNNRSLPKGSGQYTYQAAALPSGVYIAVLRGLTETATTRIVVGN